MKLFLDTANMEEIRQAARWGILAGVTTNPTLLAKEKGVDFRARIREICDLVNGPISAEVVSTDTEGMLREAHEITTWHANVVIKIPMLADGLAAVKQLSAEGIKTNVTLIFSTNQALLAAIAGATFVSPFVGRLDDISEDGMIMVRETAEIFRQHQFTCQILAASLRHPRHIVEAAKAGAHVATVPFQVLQKALTHPLTDIGLERFLADWRARSADISSRAASTA